MTDLSANQDDKYYYIPLACQQHLDLNQCDTVRCVVLSDTHNLHNEFAPLPRGDILIHTGDFTNWGLPNEISQFKSFVAEQCEHFEHVVIVPGNHEFFPDLVNAVLFSPFNSLDPAQVHYLRDETIEIKGLTIYGSRYKPYSLFGWLYPTGRDSDAKPSFSDVPRDKQLDIVLTHQPPRMESLDKKFFRRGNQALASILPDLNPRVHIFGHNHEVFGFKYAKDDRNDPAISSMQSTFISAPSVVGSRKDGRRLPIVFDIVVQPR